MNGPKIQARSWVHYGGKLTELKTLVPEERDSVSRTLLIAYMNAMFAGRASFFDTTEKPT